MFSISSLYDVTEVFLFSETYNKIYLHSNRWQKINPSIHSMLMLCRIEKRSAAIIIVTSRSRCGRRRRKTGPGTPLKVFYVGEWWDGHFVTRTKDFIHIQMNDSLRIVYVPDHRFLAITADNLSKLRSNPTSLQREYRTTKNGNAILEDDHELINKSMKLVPGTPLRKVSLTSETWQDCYFIQADSLLIKSPP